MNQLWTLVHSRYQFYRLFFTISFNLLSPSPNKSHFHVCPHTINKKCSFRVRFSKNRLNFRDIEGGIFYIGGEFLTLYNVFYWLKKKRYKAIKIRIRFIKSSTQSLGNLASTRRIYAFFSFFFFC